MKALVFGILLFFANFVSGQKKDNCIVPTQAPILVPGMVEITKQVKRFKIIDMGGVSDHSPTEFLKGGKSFRYHLWETKQAKYRFIHDCQTGLITLKCFSNDDTGPDVIQIEANGNILFREEFGNGDKYKVAFHFKEPSTIIVTVYNTKTPNHSPGAFQVTLLMTYSKTIKVWRRALISFTP